LEDTALVTRVILVRHGQSTYNAQSRIQGRSDHSTLTEEGLRMAHLAGEALKGIHFDAVYTSPLQRASLTAAAIVSHLPGESPPPQGDANLMEIDLPLWEGMTRQEVKDRDGEAYRLWQQSPEAFFMDIPDGESTRRIYPVLDLYRQGEIFWKTVLPPS
jgi:probable phosphoglycerate mutase